MPDRAILNAQSARHGSRPEPTLAPWCTRAPPRVPEPRAREISRGRPSRACKCAKKAHLIHLSIIQGASLRRRLPPPATLAHKEELKMRTNEAYREVHGFRCKLTTCKCQKSFMIHENNPDAACMDEIQRTERKSSVQATSHQLSCFVNGCIVL